MAAAGSEDVGVDLESRETAVTLTLSLLRRAATAAEARQVLAASDTMEAFLQLWVRKESLVKAGAMALDDFGSVALTDIEGYRLRSYDDNAVVAALVVMAPRTH